MTEFELVRMEDNSFRVSVNNERVVGEIFPVTIFPIRIVNGQIDRSTDKFVAMFFANGEEHNPTSINPEIIPDRVYKDAYEFSHAGLESVEEAIKWIKEQYSERSSDD